MDPLELSLGLALALVVLGVAVFFAWRQARSLRHLREQTGLSPDDQRFIRRQVARRLTGSLLLAVLAGMLIGWMFLAPSLAELRPAFENQAMTEKVKDKLRFYGGYWIVALLLLMGLLLLAVLDLWATASYGHRQQRQLEADRQEMFREEAARVRRRRSELN